MPLPRRRTYPLLAWTFWLLSPCLGSAQLPQAGDTTSPPTPGAGHDYIQAPAETVNPANGSVSIRIPLRIPSGRQLTIPLFIAYDSAGAFYYGQSSGNPVPHYATTTNVPFSLGGWSYTFPLLTSTAETWTQQYSGGKNYTCIETVNYVLQDATGNRHNMDLVGLKTPVGGDCGSAITTGGEGPILATLSGTNLLTPSVTDGNGTAYSFPTVGYHDSYLLPTSITDRDGNSVSISSTSSSASVTDTLGRTSVSVATFGASPDTINVAGLSSPYQVSWTTASASFTISQTNLQPGISQNCPTSLTGSASAVSQVVLPNGQKVAFTYDPTYGMLSKLTYPSGSYVRYVWGLNHQAEWGGWTAGSTTSWDCHYDFPAITDRYVSFNGTTEVLHQHFVYSTSWPSGSKTTTITTYDLIRNTSVTTIYAYSAVNAPCVPDDNPNGTGCAGNPTAQIPLEQCIEYYDSSGSGGTPPSPCPNLNPPGKLLKTVIKSWFNNNNRTLGSEQTTLDNGQSSLTVNCYNANELLTETDSYDLGTSAVTPPSCANNVPSGTVAGPLLRKTAETYATFTPHIVEFPSTAITYDGSGNRAAEADYTYDSPAGAVTSGIVQHSGSCNCGNLTKESRWINSGGAALNTTFTNDDTGQRLSMTDPKGNQTTYSYVDSYSSGTPPGPTNAYLTTVTAPNTGVAHTEKFAYAYASGEVTSSTDQNNQVTSYKYVDNLARLTETDFPDGGQTTLSYSDAAPSPTIATTTVITGGTSGVPLTRVATMDGLGHAIGTALTTDPDGPTYTAATYDGFGRNYQVYNPTRCNPPTTNCESTWGLTTNFYDALSRTCLVVPPDGTLPSGNPCATQPSNDVLTTYSGNTVTVTDQAGHSRKSVTDALGRLTQVFEDPAGLNYETDYTYDALDNLLSVNQKGGSTNSALWRTRTFTYDSLSRLISATNPESGNVTYTYDANGNLTYKTSPAPNQTGTATVTLTYCYDALNRLTAKAYTQQTCSNGAVPSPAATYLYDQTSYNGLTIANGIGRRTGMTDQAGSEAWSYDSMGRIAADQRTTNGIKLNTSYTYNLDGSIATITYPDLQNPFAVTFQPGGAGRPVSESSNDATYTTAVHYAPNGSLCYYQQGWGITTTSNWTFNNRFQPARIYMVENAVEAPPPPCTNPTAQGDVVDFVYTYADANGRNNGNVTQIANNTDWHRWQSFTYDSLNRISTAETAATNQNAYQGDDSLAQCWGEQFGYDPWGNLLSISSVSSSYTGCTQENLSVAVNTKNQIVGDTYDSAGNLFIAQPGNFQYTYDAENHLIATSGQTYLYDGDGKRVEKATTGTPLVPNKLYWYDQGGNSIYETDPSGHELYRYYYFAGRLIAREEANDWVDHYATDALGNVRWLYSLNNGRDIIDYYPFGGERLEYSSSAGNNTRLFTGKERDSESGLDNFGARYDSSSMGRFMSPDPDNEGAVDLDPQTWNMYSYVRNNPLRYTDPDGKNVLVCIDGQDKCHNYTDDQYASLYKQQNGQQGINLPGGAFPTGNITCGDQKCGTATYFEAPMESDNFVNMLMVAPFAGLVTSSMSAADAAAANAARQTATGATTRAASAAVNAGRANTINHIFGKAAHNLAGLVAKLGSKEAAMDALEEAATKQVLGKGINGLFKETVSVAGENVTVRGIVENGVVKIGTAYKP